MKKITGICFLLEMVLAVWAVNPIWAYLPEDTEFIVPAEEREGRDVPKKEHRDASSANHRLRSKPMEVATDDRFKVLGLDTNFRPLKYMDNDFVDNQDGTVTDRATGLTWQQSGSAKTMKLADVEKYVVRLNRKRFAGHGDWRLPTVPEMMSLIEPKKLNGDLYIDPVFDSKQRWCWSADKTRGGMAWHAYLFSGQVGWDNRNIGGYVRAVRP